MAVSPVQFADGEQRVHPIFGGLSNSDQQASGERYGVLSGFFNGAQAFGWNLVGRVVMSADRSKQRGVRGLQHKAHAGCNCGEAGDPLRTRDNLERSYPELLHGGPAAVVWGILDSVVDDYGPVVAELDRDIEEIERGIFEHGDDLTERIYVLKRETTDVYRAIHPLVQPLEAIQRGAFTGMDPALRSYFRDILDHIRRAQEEVLTQRDQLASALDANLALITLRQNEIVAQQNQVAKQLTLVATVFLPLTFVTGFFGQNFAWLVRYGINSEAEFWIFGIGGLVLSCVLLAVWFRRKKWL